MKKSASHDRMEQLRFVDNEVHVPLTQGLVAVVDADDAYLICGTAWYARKSKDGLNWYATATFFDPAKGRYVPVQMHRLIMNAPDGVLIDHWDNDGLNNRKRNLREATHAQNIRNRAPHRTNRAIFKGVHRNARDKRWIATITHEGRKLTESFRLLCDAAEQRQELCSPSSRRFCVESHA